MYINGVALLTFRSWQQPGTVANVTLAEYEKRQGSAILAFLCNYSRLLILIKLNLQPLLVTELKLN